MRESSVYAMQYEAKYGRRPLPIIGVIHFLNSKSIRDAVKQASREDKCLRTYKFNQYNLCGIAHRAKGDKDAKATIEFRQHEGSMSATAVVQWIKTTVGIVGYIHHIDNGSLTDLLRVVEHETWEKLGDGKGDKREEEHGPILGEAQFTIIHLLHRMQLYGSAAYYNDHWRKLEKKPRSTIIPTSMIEWDYENTAIPGSDEYKRLDRLREIWEENRIISAGQPSRGWKFDPIHPAWPKHSYLSDDWDAVTNPSEPSTDGSAHDYSDDDAGDKGSAPIPNPPSISAPYQELNSDPKTPDQLPETAEGLDASETALDKELEELDPTYSSDNMKARDTTWRERVRDGIGDHKGIGNIPEGNMNPFGDSEPLIKGTVCPAVSPKTVPPQAGEENDGKMPSPSK
jgi:hypothetical protein